MTITGDLDYVQGYLRYGHLEYAVPKDEEEMVKAMTEEELYAYLSDYGDLIIDDYSLNDRGEIINIKII